MFTGTTPDVREMEVHVSALAHDRMPHPPHTHREEELLLMLSGEADLILPQHKGPHGDERFPLKPASSSTTPRTSRTRCERPAPPRRTT